MTTMFTPPPMIDGDGTPVREVPNVAYDAPHPLSNRLGRHFDQGYRGRNVWQLSPDAGFATEFSFDQPWPLTENTGATRDSLHPVGGDAFPQTIEYERVYLGGSAHQIPDPDFVTVPGLTTLALILFLGQNGYDGQAWVVTT